MPEQLRPESKDLGEAATFIPNSSFAQRFQTQSMGSTFPWLTLNLLFFVAFPYTYMLKLDIIQNYQSMG